MKEEYMHISRSLIKKIGLNQAAMLSELLHRQSKEGEEWFSFTEHSIEERTGLSPHQQREIIVALKEQHFIRTKREGMPARIFFNMNSRKIMHIISPKHENKQLFEKRGQVVKKPGINKGYKDRFFYKTKRIIQSRQTGATENKDVNMIIEHWNKLPNVQRHSIGDTKTYRNLTKMIKCLKHGKFFQLYNVSNKHSKSIENKKLTNDEIIMVLNRLSKLFITGYWPEDKSKLPRSLVNLIHNPMSGYSMFVQCHESEPKRMSETIKCRYPLMLEMYSKFIESLYTKVPSETWSLLASRVNAIGNYRMAIYKRMGEHNRGTSFSSVIGGAEPDSITFAETHIAFMKREKEADKIALALVVGSYKWKDFIKWIHTFHGYDIKEA